MNRKLDPNDLIDLASDPAFVIDGNMQVTGWNSGAEQLLGYSTQEALGRKCGQILQALLSTGEPLCSTSCEGRECFLQGRKWSVHTCKVRHRNGDVVKTGISTLVLPRLNEQDDGNDPLAVVFLREVNGMSTSPDVETPLRIYTLGHFGLTVADNGLDVESWRRKQAALVLKCLVSQLDRPVHRERLIEWLWPNADPDRGWQRLKVAVSFLRKRLHEGGARRDTIETIGQSYLLRRNAVWVDSDVFATLVNSGWEYLKSGNRAKAQACFEDADTLYRGDYFEDEPYAEWCAEERARLREVYLELLTGIARCYSEDRRYLEASRVCRTALNSDPCREIFVRSLLENLIRLDRPDLAKAQFLAWQRHLLEEFGFEPTRETMNTYLQLVDV